MRDNALWRNLESQIPEYNVPTGQGVTNARIEVDWEVSPGDDARYWIRIEVKGPKGTLPF